jgi:hypothetical protein
VAAALAAWLAVIASRHERLSWDRPLLVWIHHHDNNVFDRAPPASVSTSRRSACSPSSSSRSRACTPARTGPALVGWAIAVV